MENCGFKIEYIVNFTQRLCWYLRVLFSNKILFIVVADHVVVNTSKYKKKLDYSVPNTMFLKLCDL